MIFIGVLTSFISATHDNKKKLLLVSIDTDLYMWEELLSHFCNIRKSTLSRSYGKKENIWLIPITKNPTHTEKSKKQRDNTKNATKNSEFTTIADWLRAVSWSNDSDQTGVVNPVYGIPVSSLSAKAV